jgi:hypothetical protein
MIRIRWELPSRRIVGPPYYRIGRLVTLAGTPLPSRVLNQPHAVVFMLDNYEETINPQIVFLLRPSPEDDSLIQARSMVRA